MKEKELTIRFGEFHKKDYDDLLELIVYTYISWLVWHKKFDEIKKIKELIEKRSV